MTVLKTEGLSFKCRKVETPHLQAGFEIQVMVFINCIDEDGEKCTAAAVLTTQDFSRLCADVAADINKLHPKSKIQVAKIIPPGNLRLNGN